MNGTSDLHKILQLCATGRELVPFSTLCASVSSMGMRDPVVVEGDESLATCIELLAQHKHGSVLIVDDCGHLVGIFTERDCVTKVVGKVDDLSSVRVSEFMTVNPVRERPDTTIAFALNLMSHGGFRHLPITDEHGMPIGTVSAKDVVDYLVTTMLHGIDGVTSNS